MRRLNRDEFKVLYPGLRVVAQQVGRIDQRKFILDAEAEDIVGRIEPSVPQPVFDLRHAPDRAVGKDDLFKARFGPEELVGHGDRIDQEAVIAFELDEEVVTEPQERQVFRRQLRRQNQPVDVTGIPQFLNRVFRTVEAEEVIVGPEAPFEQIVAKPTIKDIRTR